MKEHASGASYHNRYPYSGKIICEEHGTTFHRRVLNKKSGDEEVWQCKVYRTGGRAACAAPQLRSAELDSILAEIFTQMVKDRNIIIDSLLAVLQSVPQEVDYSKAAARVEDEMAALNAKKDRLLELNLDGAISNTEFKTRNDGFNHQLQTLETQIATIRAEERRQKESALDTEQIRRVLEKELSFENGINSNLVSTILDRVIVKRESTKQEIHLDIFLKLGTQFEAVYDPKNLPERINRAKILRRRKRSGGLDLHRYHRTYQGRQLLPVGKEHQIRNLCLKVHRKRNSDALSRQTQIQLRCLPV